MAAARASLRKPSTRLGSDTSFKIKLQVRMINPPTPPYPIPTYQTSSVFQWRSQPDNLVMRYANFKSLLISLKNDCFHGLWTQKYLHSMTRLSGWLRHCCLPYSKHGDSYFLYHNFRIIFSHYDFQWSSVWYLHHNVSWICNFPLLSVRLHNVQIL
jgi:hypothetical protein